MHIRTHVNTGTAHLFNSPTSLCGRASVHTTEAMMQVRWGKLDDKGIACGRCYTVAEGKGFLNADGDVVSTLVEKGGSPNGDLPLSDVPILELDEITLTIVTWRGHGEGMIEDLLPAIAQAEGYQVLAPIDTSITEREGRVTLA